MKIYRAAIVIDSWKLSTFERRLKQCGYAFNNLGEPVKGTDTLLLQVMTPNLVALGEVVKQAIAECEKTGKPQ